MSYLITELTNFCLFSKLLLLFKEKLGFRNFLFSGGGEEFFDKFMINNCLMFL